MSYTRTYTNAREPVEWAKVACFTAGACLLIALTIVAFFVAGFLQHEDERMAETHYVVESTIRGSRTDAKAELDAMRKDVVTQVIEIRNLLDKRSADTLEETRQMRLMVDRRTVDALEEVKQIRLMTNERTQQALGIVDTRTGEALKQ